MSGDKNRVETEWRPFLERRYCISATDADADEGKNEATCAVQDAGYPYSSAELLQPDSLDAVMRLHAEQLGQPVNRVVGMMFAKRYSVLIMGVLSTMSLYDRMPNVAPDLVRFRVTRHAEMIYRLSAAVASGAGWTAEERDARAEELMTRLQAEHIGPVYAAVAHRTGARPGTMWSLLSANIQNMYLRMLRQKSLLPAGRAAIIEADRNRLLDRTRNAVAGFARNPLAVRLQQFRHPAYQGPPVVLRKACCLAYKLQEDGHAHGYCATCPSSSAEERIRRLAAE